MTKPQIGALGSALKNLLIIPFLIVVLWALASYKPYKNSQEVYTSIEVDTAFLKMALASQGINYNPETEILVLNHWATWCGPCIKEMPALDEIASLFPNRDSSNAQIKFIAFSDESQGKVDTLVKKLKWETDPNKTYNRLGGMASLAGYVNELCGEYKASQVNEESKAKIACNAIPRHLIIVDGKLEYFSVGGLSSFKLGKFKEKVLESVYNNPNKVSVSVRF